MATSVGVSPIPGLATVATRSSSLLLLEKPSVGSSNRRKQGSCYSRPASRQHLQRKHQQQSSRRFRFGKPSSLCVSLSLTDRGLKDGVVGTHLLSCILQKNQSSSAWEKSEKAEFSGLGFIWWKQQGGRWRSEWKQKHPPPAVVAPPLKMGVGHPPPLQEEPQKPLSWLKLTRSWKGCPSVSCVMILSASAAPQLRRQHGSC